MGSIDKRVLKDGKTLRYDARIHRRRDGGTLSKSFKSKAAAQEWINEVETKINGNITVSRKAETATFPDAAKHYLAEARPKNKEGKITYEEKKCISQICEDFTDDLVISKITSSKIQAWIDAFLERPIPLQKLGKNGKPHPYYNRNLDKKTGKTRLYSEGTVRRHYFIFRKVLKWYAAKNKFELDSNLFTLLEIPRAWAGARERRLTAEELTQLEEAADRGYENKEAWKLLINFAIFTCCRAQEIVKADWKHINKSGRAFNIPPENVKTSTFRQVPLSKKSMAIIESLEKLKKEGESRIFHMFKNVQTVSKGFRRICVRAEIDDLRFHDLRHTGIANLFEFTELSDIEIQLITGHTNAATLKRYAQLRPSYLASKMDEIEEKRSKKTTEYA
jgi:integrase